MSYVETLEKTLHELKADLTEVETRKYHIERAIASIQELLTGGKQDRVPSPTLTEDSTSQLIPIPLWAGRMSYPKAAEQVLRENGAPLHIKDIVLRMQRLGIAKDKEFKKLRGSVIPTLEKRVREGKTFTKTAPATYGLLEFPAGGVLKIITDGNER